MRPLGYARGAYGLGLVLASLLAARRPRGRRPDRATVGFAAVLGLRQLVEAGLLAAHRADQRWLVAGAVVDAVHAATVALIATSDRRHRRWAFLNVATATLLTGEGLRESRWGPPAEPWA